MEHKLPYSQLNLTRFNEVVAAAAAAAVFTVLCHQ